MMYKLADRIQMVGVNRRVFLVDDEITELEDCSKAQYQALRLLIEGCRMEELEAILEWDDLQELLELISSLGLLRKNWSNEYIGDIVEKQVYYLDDFSDQPNLSQRMLAEAKVAIVGVGGVGGIVLQHLVGAGFKNFILIDGDHVQRDNQNRQFIYPTLCIGRPKVEVAKEYVHQIDNTIEVSTYQLMVESDESLSILDNHEVDILINAADQPADLYKFINRYCTRRRIPWISAGVGRQSGYWGPMVIPNQTICMECFFRIEDNAMSQLEKKIRMGIRSTIQASFGATNTVISALLAKDVVLYLALKGKEHVASFGTRCTMNFQTLEITRFAPDKPTAAGCSCWKGVPVCNSMV